MSSPLNDSRHPLWGLLRWVVVVLVAAVGFWIACWRNAENFDETELNALKEFVIAIAGVEAVRQTFYSWHREKKEEQ